MLLRFTPALLAIAVLCSADTLTLRSGRTVNGQFLGGTARQVRMAVGDRVETFDVSDISDLQFGDGGAPAPAPAPPPPAPDSDRDRDRGDRGRDPNGFASQQPPPQVSGVQIATGTTIVVRMIDSVDSERASTGQTFRASVDEPVLVDGQTVIPRGADAVVKLVEDQQSGKFEGRTVLTLVLHQVMINGRMVDSTTADVSQSSGSRGARTAKVVGGTTALGAIIGALAGGGRGAAIGAASGAAVGGGAQVITKGQTVKIPSETRLTFTLQQPIQL
jgi:hypothetical protein